MHECSDDVNVVMTSMFCWRAALVWGDPHIETLDGYEYTFNGIGEYTMLRLFDNSFTLQARTKQITSAQGAPVQASKWSAFAAQVRDNTNSFQTVQIEMNADETGACVMTSVS